MRKVTRNLSLPKIKTNYNSIKANIKTISNTKRSKHIINKNPFNNLLIYIRFTPLIDKEKEITSNEIVNIPDNNTIILKKNYKYIFDYVFDKTVEHNTFFEKGIKSLINDFFENKKNICIFNYGAKESRNIFNLIGKDLLGEIYNKINTGKDKEYILKYSFYEILDNNNTIIDLLKEKKEKENLNKNDSIIEIKVTSDKDIKDILIKENKTNNSYIILQIFLGYKINSTVKYNKFTLIDLDNLNPFFDIENKKQVLNNDSKLLNLINDTKINNQKNVIITHISNSINNFEEIYKILNYMEKIKNLYSDDYIIKIKKIKNEISKVKEILSKNSNTNKNKEKIMNQNNKNIKIHLNENSISNNPISNTFNKSINIKKFPKTITCEDIPLNENNIKNKNNNITEKEFQEMISELRKACDNQVTIKQKIISIQREIDRANEENNLNNLKNELNKNMNEYKEYSLKIEKIYNEIKLKENITEMQKYLLNLIMRNSSYKIQMLDNKYQNLINITKINFLEEYIKELEKQIQYRDEIFLKNGIILNKNIYPKLKLLNNLKSEFLVKNINSIDSIHNFKNKENSDSNNFSISLKNIKIKNYFLNEQKMKEYKYKHLLNNNTINKSVLNDKEKNNIFFLFKQNSEDINKKLKEINSLSTLKYSDITYESDFIENNKKIFGNQNELKKAFTKRNLKSKIIMDNKIN